MPFHPTKSKRLSAQRIVLSAALSVLASGCASNYMAMPHLGPEAFCAAGDCNNGHGTKKAKEADYAITGNWQNGELVDGDYQVSFEGKSWTTHYRDGAPETGAKLYQHSFNNEFDVFVGSWQSYTDPFSGSRVIVPLDGTYSTTKGFHFTGIYKVFPTMGGSRMLYQQDPEGAYWAYLNAVFIGMIEYNGQKEVGIYVRRNWMAGTPLISAHEGMIPADDAVLQRLQQETRAELATREHWQSKQKASEFNIDFGKVFVLAAGVAMASRSGLSSDTQLEFITAYSRDVMAGSTSNLETLKDKYADNRSADEMLRDFNQSAAGYAKPATTAQVAATRATATPAASASTTGRAQSAQQVCISQRDFLWLEDEQRCISKNTLAAKQCGLAGGSYTNNGCIINTIAYAPRFPGQSLNAGTNLYPGMPGSNTTVAATSARTQAEKPAKRECVARNESGIELTRVAASYCNYVLSDYTRTAEYTFDNVTWGNDSSSSEERAKEQLKDKLKAMADRKCAAEGYTTVFNDDTLKAHDVTPSVRECKSKWILGGDEFICRGTTSFFCGRYQSGH